MKPRTKFFSGASYAVTRGLPIEELYEFAKDYENVTKEDVDSFIQNKQISKKISTAVMATREQKEIIYNQLDVKFIAKHKNLILFRRSENNVFFEYHNGVYAELTDQEMYDLVDTMMSEEQLFDYRTSSRKIQDSMRRIASLLARTKGRFFSDFDIDKQEWKINLKNGLLNTKTWTLEPHTPDYFSLVQVPFDYNPEAQAPEFMEFLKKVSNFDESNALMIHEMFGYCLLEGNPKHKIFYLFGDTARNGKTTTALILIGLLGRQNVSTLSLSQLAGEKSSPLVSLIGKQLNFSDEISSKFIDSSRLTSMSAEGIVEIDPKFKSAFLYKVKAKFIVACNDLPQMTDSQGMKHRMIVIPFRYHIPAGDRIERFEEVLLKKEGSGILNWAIEAAKKMQVQKEFTINTDSIEEMNENNLQNNTAYAYLESNYDFSKEYTDKYYLDELYGDAPNKEDSVGSGYRRFCKDKGVGTPSEFKFLRDIKKFARETGKIEAKKTEGGARYYVGLKKKSNLKF